MKPLKRLTRNELLGANYATDGVTVEGDWRYEMVMDYLRLSHSYKSVLLTMQGRKSPYPLPSDYAAVEAVVRDFQDIQKIGEMRWWDTVGKALFGIRTPARGVELIGKLDASNPVITSTWKENESLVVTIPVTLKPSKIFRQLQELIATQHLPQLLPLPVTPKYTISNNRMHQQTMNLGIGALRRYEAGMKLREIGHWLAEYAEAGYEETAVRRLIRLSALIAENAARGRFFSNKLFPEALINTYQRKAGRPAGTKGIKWKKGRMSV